VGARLGGGRVRRRARGPSAGRTARARAAPIPVCNLAWNQSRRPAAAAVLRAAAAAERRCRCLGARLGSAHWRRQARPPAPPPPPGPSPAPPRGWGGVVAQRAGARALQQAPGCHTPGVRVGRGW